MEFLGSPHGERASGSVYGVLMQSLARENPEGALAWAAGLPEERVQEASNRAMSIWTDHQPGEALEWLVALPASDRRRPDLLRGFVTNITYRADTEVAEQRLARLAPSDHGLAREEIERAGIPAGKKERLLEVLSRGDD